MGKIIIKNNLLKNKRTISGYCANNLNMFNKKENVDI